MEKTWNEDELRKEAESLIGTDLLEQIGYKASALFAQVIENTDTSQVLNIDEKKNIVNKLKESYPYFFSENNIIFLKLVNLYNKLTKDANENQDLYYVIDVFSPSPDELAMVNESYHKILDDIINEDNLKLLYDKEIDLDYILELIETAIYIDEDIKDENLDTLEYLSTSYKEIESEDETFDYEEEKSKLEEEIDDITGEIEYMNEFLKNQNDDTIFDSIKNDSDLLSNLKKKVGKDLNLADLVTDVYGTNLTAEEWIYVKGCLTQEQNEILLQASTR